MINVLICDDNREYAAYIQSLFETVVSKSEFGDLVYNCKCFSDSALALRYCQKTTVHVALLDIDMPEVDGFQLALAMQDKAFVIFPVVLFALSVKHIFRKNCRKRFCPLWRNYWMKRDLSF